VNYPSFPIKSQ